MGGAHRSAFRRVQGGANIRPRLHGRRCLNALVALATNNVYVRIGATRFPQALGKRCQTAVTVHEMFVSSCTQLSPDIEYSRSEGFFSSSPLDCIDCACLGCRARVAPLHKPGSLVVPVTVLDRHASVNRL